MRFDCTPLARGPYKPENSPASAAGNEHVGGWITTSFFGPRIDPIKGGPGNHGGQDIAGAGINGQPVYATNNGVLRYLSPGQSGGGGNWLTLEIDGHTSVGYGHLQRWEAGLVGQRVKAGTVIGHVGSTGNSTGPHLHLRVDDEDPDLTADDPHDVYWDAAINGRYPGATPTPPTQEELDVVTQADMKGIADAVIQAFAYGEGGAYQEARDRIARSIASAPDDDHGVHPNLGDVINEVRAH